VKLYDGREPIFHQHEIEQESRVSKAATFPLKGGGSIVIDQTEALVAIDVNSGNFRMDDDAEKTLSGQSACGCRNQPPDSIARSWRRHRQ